MLNKVHKILLFLFLFSLFFPIRHVFLTNSAYLTGQYSDFTSFSLYLSDILLFLLFILTLYQYFRINKSISLLFSNGLSLIAFLFWLILGLTWHYHTISGLNIYFFVKWLELAVVAYGTALLVTGEKGIENRIKQYFVRFFVLFCSIQSILALLQFWKHSSLGLYRLGESHLGPGIANVAKIVADGHIYTRGYGTFPHPNVLAAFLVIAIILSIYLLLNSTWKNQIWWGIAIFVNILGLTVTFSRAAYLGLVIGLLIFFGLLTIIKNEAIKTQKVIVMVIVIVSGAFSFLLFRPYLMTRATIKDNAVTERIEYNNIGLRMITVNPIFGVGAGESVLHMEQYSNVRLESWQKQPIHNYFLLSAAELGIPGALILIWIFFSHLKAITYKLKEIEDFPLFTFRLSLFSILSIFLILMLFDHYFYTLQQTQILLWITLGVIAGTTKKEASAS